MFKLPVVTLTFLAAVTTTVAQGQTADPVRERVESAVSRLKSTDPDQQFAALTELGDMGPLAKNAVPALVNTLKATDDIALKHEVLISLERIGTEASPAIPAVTGYLNDRSPVLQHQALHTLRQMGPLAKAAVPQIQKLLNSDSPVIRTGAAWALASISDDVNIKRQAAPVLVNGLKSQDPNVLSDAVTGLAELGQPAVNGLVKLLDDPNATVAMHAADALGLMGPAAAPATGDLVQTLKHQDEQVAAHAAQALGAISANAETVVPALTDQLGSQSEIIRVASAFALGRFGEAAKSAVPGLANRLSDPSVDVRVAAAQTLGSIGPDAAGAVPQLEKAMDDSAGIVTLSAFEALGAIKGPAVSVLAKRLSDPAFLPLAAAVLGQMGADASPATSALVKQLKSTDDQEAQFEILVALGSIGPKAAAAVPDLMDLAKAGKESSRRGAIYALAKIGDDKAIPVFQANLRNAADPLLQRVSAWGLVMLDPTNQQYINQALPLLSSALEDEMPLVRKEAAIAIQKMGSKGASGVPALVKALETSGSSVQVEILDALAQVGPAAQPALPEAVKLLSSPDPTVRYTATYLLGQLGEAAKGATPALEKILEGQDEFGQAVAAWALVKIDPTPKHRQQAVPFMIKALEHEVPNVRAQAAEMLGVIGLSNPQAKAALQKAAQDDDETVRKAAQAALSKLN